MGSRGRVRTTPSGVLSKKHAQLEAAQYLEVVSQPRIKPEGKAQADSKAQHAAST